jgi:hypothetical protein
VPEEESESTNHIDLPDLYNASFAIKQPTLVWVENDPRDGIFTFSDPNTRDILLESVEDGKSEIYVHLSDLVSLKVSRVTLVLTLSRIFAVNSSLSMHLKYLKMPNIYL